MTLWSVARWLELCAFAGLGVVAIVQWRRHSGKAAARLAQAFSLLGAFVVLRRFLPEEPTGGAQWALKVLIVVLALFPFCLYRFTGAFTSSSRRSDILACSATAVVTVATLCLPSLARAPEGLPAWAVLYRIAFVADWTVLSAMATSRLWRSGRRQPTVIRRRMRTLGLAAAVLNLAILMASSSTTPDSGVFAVSGQILGLVATVLFVVGFAPPSVLRLLWRRREVAAFHRAEADLMVAVSTAQVANIVLPHAAELAGARAAVLFDAAGSALAQHQMTDEEVAALSLRLVSEVQAAASTIALPGLVAIRVRDGWMAMTTSESTPFFGSGEVELLESLAHFAGLALERAELQEHQRRGQLALSEREAQLAEAQQTAHLGSYRWDLRAQEVTWSDEMYRVLGFEPGDPSARRSFMDRVHPDDRARVSALREGTANQSEPSTTDYRIVLPDGQVRWIQGRLSPTVENGVTVLISGTLQDITETKVAEELIAFQARHDFLTQLPVRSLFIDRLDAALGRRDSGNGSVAVLLFDVDRFKWLNDSLGHAAGDRLLVEFARRLQSVVRPEDLVARFGGDEFVVLCEDVGPDDARNLAERMAQALTSPIDVGGGATTMTVSVGISLASFTDDEATPDSLVRDADTAMYRAKEVGRNCIEIFDITARLVAFARHETANALRRGIDAEELVVFFQPEVDITTGETVGVEALVRWDHPQRGLVPPAEFITIAEETGLIVPLGAAVLREACSVMASWQRLHTEREAMTVSVNLSARQLLAPNLADVVDDALSASGLAPQSLCLEITESVLLDDSDACARVLERLKSTGVHIGVDDFGTGFSSLTYLKRFPVDILKIDRSFVDGLGRSREDRAIVAGIIDLAHAFGLTTIAEGIENAEQLAELKALGCELGQGYFWSRPLPACDVDEWISAASARLPREVERATPRRGRRCPHRVLLVDDDQRMRKLLRLVLDGGGVGGDTGEFEVIGETEDGREAIALARHHRPDIVLLDLAMPGMGGLEALPLILAVAPDAKVVIFSGLESAAFGDAAVRHGAAAYITKGSDPTDLCRVLRPLLSASAGRND